MLCCVHSIYLKNIKSYPKIYYFEKQSNISSSVISCFSTLAHNITQLPDETVCIQEDTLAWQDILAYRDHLGVACSPIQVMTRIKQLKWGRLCQIMKNEHNNE